MSQVIKASEDNFDEVVLGSDVPVLVDFYAEWCGPCKNLSPELDKLASSVGERAKVVKVDVEEEKSLADAYQVRGLPTIVFIANGEVFHTHRGVTSAKELERMLFSQS